MTRIQSVGLFLSITGLVAGEPSWMSKRLAEWNAQDAQQVLLSSPWVKRVTPGVIGGLTAFQKRDGGDMTAGGPGTGVDAGEVTVTGGKIRPGESGNVPAEPSHRREQTVIRWESALPIRAAELRTNESGAPVLDGDEYAIAVYDVSLKTANSELKGLTEALRRTAMLKIEGKKDVKPVRVAVLGLGGGVITVVYLFPRSANITLEDKRVDFSAQIGRVFVAQSFYPAEMQFQGKLEL